MAHAVATVVSALSGLVLGFGVAYYPVILIAIIRDENPFHVGYYGYFFIALLAVVPIGLSLWLGILTWQERIRKRALIAMWSISSIFVGFQIYLEFVE